jgi:glycosyltransferase involved in cell wall biosynthesis
LSFSILILTYNEERNIARCLESVVWCDDIVVLDSNSGDATVQVAREFGAGVALNPFVSFAEQRNWGMRNIPFRHKWVFHLDADERFTPELAAECRAAVAADRYSGFLVPSKMMLFGKWLKHAAAYPVYQTRLVKTGELWFEQVGHGQREGPALRGIGTLSEPYLHYSFSAGFDRWFEKHNAYSASEARLRLFGRAPCAEADVAPAVLRVRKLKQLARRLPCRPLFVWLYLYLVRCGFLDGRAGFTFCSLRALYEYMIDLKADELRARSAGQTL